MDSVYIKYLRDKAVYLRQIADRYQESVSELLIHLADEFEMKANAIEAGHEEGPAHC